VDTVLSLVATGLICLSNTALPPTALRVAWCIAVCVPTHVHCARKLEWQRYADRSIRVGAIALRVHSTQWMTERANTRAQCVGEKQLASTFQPTSTQHRGGRHLCEHCTVLVQLHRTHGGCSANLRRMWNDRKQLRTMSRSLSSKFLCRHLRLAAR
jgi:hypothetical protein